MTAQTLYCLWPSFFLLGWFLAWLDDPKAFFRSAVSMIVTLDQCIADTEVAKGLAIQYVFTARRAA